MDVRDHISVGVGGGQVDGSAGLGAPVSRVQSAAGVDQRRALGQVGRVQKMLHIDIHPRRVGDISMRIGKRQLHRLDLEVEAVGGVHRQVADSVMPQDTEHAQRRQPLSVGWNLMQRVAAIAN